MFLGQQIANTWPPFIFFWEASSFLWSCIHSASKHWPTSISVFWCFIFPDWAVIRLQYRVLLRVPARILLAQEKINSHIPLPTWCTKSVGKKHAWNNCALVCGVRFQLKKSHIFWQNTLSIMNKYIWKKVEIKNNKGNTENPFVITMSPSMKV